MICSSKKRERERQCAETGSAVRQSDLKIEARAFSWESRWRHVL